MPSPGTRRARQPSPAPPFVVYHELPSRGRLLTGGLLTTFAGNPERGQRPPGDKQNPNYDADGKRRSEDERKPRYKIELLVRTYLGDVGIRPATDPNLVFWESPDIWIDGPSGDPDQATPGVLNTVKVHIWNVGLADCWAAHVDVFWCDPSVGISPALATPIGSTVVTLMGGAHTILSFPWVPSMANGGHECLVVHLYDPVSDPIVAPFNPTLDRHVGQRNISVVEAVSAQPFHFTFAVPNLTMSAAMSTLSVEMLTGEAREHFFQTIGAPAQRTTRGAGPATLQTLALRRIPAGDAILQLTTGALRERHDLTPGRTTVRRVSMALHAAAAQRGRRQSRSPLHSPASWELTSPAQPRAIAEETGSPTRRSARAGAEQDVQLPPHSVLQVALRGKSASAGERTGREVYRVIERMNGRVTGGVTVMVKALTRKPREAKRGRRARGSRK